MRAAVVALQPKYTRKRLKFANFGRIVQNNSERKYEEEQIQKGRRIKNT